MYGLDINSFSKQKINIGIFNPIEIQYLISKYKDLFEIEIIETYADERTRYERSLNRLSTIPFDYEGLAEICRRNLSDEEDFNKISDIERYQLETITPFSSYFNDGFMSAIIYRFKEDD